MQRYIGRWSTVLGLHSAMLSLGGGGQRVYHVQEIRDHVKYAHTFGNGSKASEASEDLRILPHPRNNTIDYAHMFLSLY